MKYRIALILAVVGGCLIGCKDRMGTSQPPSSEEEDKPLIELDDTKRNPDYLYDIESVPEILLEVTEDNWNTYLSNLDQWPDNSLYVPASFTFSKGGHSFHRDSVGLRPRGNTSRRRPESSTGQMHQDGAQWHHAHFGICFTEYESGERFFGTGRLILKWAKDDPTYCHEMFSYDLFRRFKVWSAPRCSYCRLSIHIQGDTRPVYMGVYSMIENPRKGYLASRTEAGLFPDNDGNLWKCAYGASLSDANKGIMGLQDDYGLSYSYNLKSNKKKLNAAQQELCDFIEGMKPLASGSNELKSWLLAHIDVDLLLRATAVNVMVGMWDDYWVNQNNYFLYFDSSHKMYFIPFDYDNTLGTANSGFPNPGTQNPLQWGSRQGDRLLMRKVLSIPEFENTYKAYLKEIATSPELMETHAAMARVRKLQSLIEPYIKNDTGEDMTIQDLPAPWSCCPKYRLLSGGVGDGKTTESNFFQTKNNQITW